MREIKFRAWNKKYKRMVEGNSIVFNKSFENGIGIIHGFDRNLKKNVVLFSENVDLIQYVRLKDKNKVEIYEGDIVKIKYEAITSWLTDKIEEFEAIGKVAFLNEDYHSGRKMSEFVIIIPTGWVEFFNCKEIEVIGNIYENPELLREVREEK